MLLRKSPCPIQLLNNKLGTLGAEGGIPTHDLADFYMNVFVKEQSLMSLVEQYADAKSKT
jgi:hypothetical protein